MRFLAGILCASFVLLSCNSNSGITAKGEENLKLVNDFFNHFNNHEWQKMASMYADTAYFKDPSFGTDIVVMTPQQTAEKYAGLGEIFPDLKDSVIASYASGDHHVFTEFISTGTSSDGSKLFLPIATIFTIENGKITRDHTYYDNMEQPQQDSSAVKK